MRHLLAQWARRVASEVYQDGHQPDSDGPPAHALVGGDSFMPDDTYEHLDHYTGNREWLPETRRTLTECRGKPDAQITIYRAAPPGTGINNGDWITLSKEYARQHIQSNGDPDWKVYVAQVPAHTVRFAGDDLMEWGYWGPGANARVARLAFNSNPTEAERTVAAAIRDMHGGLIDIKRVGEIAVDAADGDADEAMRLIKNAMEWWDYMRSYRDRNGDRFTRSASSEVKEGPVPLDYPYGGKSTRFYIEDPSFEGDDRAGNYFKQPGTIAFLDLFVQGPDEVFIAYMATHRGNTGKGYARKLVQTVYDRYAGKGKTINWGEVYDEHAGTLVQKFTEQYPDTHTRYKVRW